MPSSKTCHFARAHEEHLPSGERIEDLAPKRNGGITHRYGVLGNAGFGANALSYGERLFKDARQAGPARSGLLGGPIRLFDLTQDLRLAEHH